MAIEIPDNLTLSQKLEFLNSCYKSSQPPLKPEVPLKFEDGNPDAFIMYGEALKKYKQVYEKWYKLEKPQIDKYNNDIICQCVELVKEESGLNYLKVSDNTKAKIWGKAWDVGHSCGYYEVYLELCDLIALFEKD